LANRGEFGVQWNMSSRQVTRGWAFIDEALGTTASGPGLAD
jgi:hypothetical protein